MAWRTLQGIQAVGAHAARRVERDSSAHRLCLGGETGLWVGGQGEVSGATVRGKGARPRECRGHEGQSRVTSEALNSKGFGVEGGGWEVGHPTNRREECECSVGHADGWGSWSP